MIKFTLKMLSMFLKKLHLISGILKILISLILKLGFHKETKNCRHCFVKLFSINYFELRNRSFHQYHGS